MALSQKYGRTYHYPFSPGTTSDDRINQDYWHDISQIQAVIHTEKLDGENNCLNRYGVFARSHAAPTISPWTAQLRQHWQLINHDLGNLEIFGENLYAIHSIEYQKLEHYYYVFAIREMNTWLSWEETVFYAQFFSFPTVPVLSTVTQPLEKKSFESEILAFTQQPSVFGSVDTQNGQSCTCEGIVSRDMASYESTDFQHHVFKYVRKGHVKTDEHWTRNWKRASLIWERRNVCGD